MPDPAFLGRTLDQGAASAWIVGPDEDTFSDFVERVGAAGGLGHVAIGTRTGSSNVRDTEVYVAQLPIIGVTDASEYPRIVVPDEADPATPTEPVSSQLISIVAPGDLDVDGSADILLAMREVAYVFPSAFADELRLGDAFATFTITGSGGLQLWFGAPGDIDGDGDDDVAVGFPADSAADNGAVYLFDGPFAGPQVPTDAFATVRGAASASVVGYHQEGADHDGDGAGDLLLTGIGSNAGYVVVGPVLGDVVVPADAYLHISVDEIPSHILAADDIASFRVQTLHSAGDLDGDGHHDLLFTPFFIIAGPSAGSIEAAAGAAATLIPPTDLDMGHPKAGGDIDGDGFGDIVLGSSLGGQVLYGPFSGTVDAREVGDRLAPWGLGTSSIEGVGDVDGDGLDDLMLIGATDPVLDVYGVGAAYLFLGGF